ncbi:hypothetical protein [Paenibacillus agricola]|uniref:Uncharacterized protein n=1 Tax=Paenibacillus agricola TaxID=2716264 RepID=A0ABX0J5U0_9BACL|nr:hypothetical protein [Paenibacillus agricola]NHN29456.1 hypothetical protein [Paenibacillus agricola]
MLEFEFEVMTESSIHLRYLFGGEWFTFNLFLRDDVWILHPFEGILLGNKEMSRLVIAEMFSNKIFLVMLAKERILLSNIHSSIDLGHREKPAMPKRGGMGERAGTVNRNHPAIPEIPEISEVTEATDDLEDLDAFIQGNSLEQVIEQERSLVLRRVTYYKEILKRMFMDGMGPNDEEFDKVRNIVKIYEETAQKLGNPGDFSGNNHNRFQ